MGREISGAKERRKGSNNGKGREIRMAGVIGEGIGIEMGRSGDKQE